MTLSDGALREGLVHDLLNRIYDHDIRSKTVQVVAKHFHTDEKHASQVIKTIDYILDQLDNPSYVKNSKTMTQFLHWGAMLHGIGLNIAHNQYHKHGAYIIEKGDFSGFSRQDQILLSTLVYTHRKKFSNSRFKKLPAPWDKTAPYLAIILRLAILLHRNRHTLKKPRFKISINDSTIRLEFANHWLNDAPLTYADLETEAKYLHSADYKLIFKNAD
jgi:exopolyphosphatase/guanosine-5'-triphosphate,3'-diphosphate pyrophosphatase